MKSFKEIILAVMLAVVAVGCTHNNGDIGDWFGTWKLETIATDGVPDKDYNGNIMWKFQNNIISMDYLVPDSHAVWSHFGTWSCIDDRLLLDFTHSDNETEPGTGQYQPFPQTHIPAAKSELTVEKLTSSHLELRYAPADGKVYTYKFKKWG